MLDAKYILILKLITYNEIVSVTQRLIIDQYTVPFSGFCDFSSCQKQSPERGVSCTPSKFPLFFTPTSLSPSEKVFFFTASGNESVRTDPAPDM